MDAKLRKKLQNRIAGLRVRIGNIELSKRKEDVKECEQLRAVIADIERELKEDAETVEL